MDMKTETKYDRLGKKTIADLHGKLKIYLVEFNLMMGNAIYLPLATALLKTYAMKNNLVRENYQFMPYIFKKDKIENLISLFDKPEIVAFSCSMWNYNLNLKLAEEIKRRFPDCLIIMGGPNIPFDAKHFLNKNKFVDVTIRGEGEKTFNEILAQYLISNDFSKIKGISYRSEDGHCIKNDEEQDLIMDLGLIPSPYLAGEFDAILGDQSGLSYQAIIETNRGCPFNCGYCFWGMGGLNKKMRLVPMANITGVANWIANNKIEYIFCADSNFGMFERDIEIAKYYAAMKKEKGYPEKFRVCFAKNSENWVFEIGKIFNKSELSKSTTLSLQSKNPQALLNVGRKNISLEVFKNLHFKCAEEDIPVYTEFILGLPGETYHSFLDGLRGLIKNNPHNEIFIYLCQVYPNTGIADEFFVEKHGVKTIRIPLNEVHCRKNDDTIITEYENIICATNTMSTNDLMKLTVISTFLQCFMSLKLLYYPLTYLAKKYDVDIIHFIEYVMKLTYAKEDESLADNVILSKLSRHILYAENIFIGRQGRGIYDERYGEIYWEIEEYSFMEILLCNRNVFVNNLIQMLEKYLAWQKIEYDKDVLMDCIQYQAAMLPMFNMTEPYEYKSNYDFVTYFGLYSLAEDTQLEKKKITIEVTSSIADIQQVTEFARKVVLYGRKGGGLSKMTAIRIK